MTPREQALGNIPEAQNWINSAVGALNFVIGFGGQRSQIDQLPQFRAMKTHFHVTLGPRPGILRSLLNTLPFVEDPTVAILQDIRFKYWDVQRALDDKSIFRDSPAEGEGEDATAFVPRNRDGTIRITPNYMKVGPMSQTLVVIHEGMHFLGDEFQDWSYRDRTGEPEPERYKTLPVQFAIRNPDSYAYFALQMAKDIDRILKNSE